MSKQRLIDANKVETGFDELCQSPYFKNDVNAKHGAETLMDLCVRSDSHKTNTIDPETLPIVRELRGELERVTAERDAAVKWANELKSEKAAAIGELNGVLASVYRLTEFVDDEVHPVVDYDLYLQLRDMVDEVIRWEHAGEWCPDGDHI